MLKKIMCRSFKTHRNIDGIIQPVTRIGFFWEGTKKPVKKAGYFIGFTHINNAKKYAENNIPQNVDFSKWFLQIEKQ